MFISLLLRQPHHPDIEKWAERVITSSSLLQDPNLRIFSEVDVSLYFQWRGHFAKAEEVLAPLRRLVRQRQVTPLAFTTLKAFEAMYYALKGDHESCLVVVSEGLKVVKTTGVITMLPQLLMHGTASALGAGALASAEKFLKDISLKAEDSQRMNIAYYHYLLAWNFLLRNEMIRALEHITIARDLVVRIGFPFMEAIIRHGMAQILFEVSDYEEAERNLTIASQIGFRMGSQMIRYMCLLTEAQFAFGRGKEHKGLKYLQQAMAIGKKYGFIHFIFWRPDIMARLCVKALEAGIEEKYVIELIKKRNLVPEIPPVEVTNWPWPIRIYSLGRFSLIVNGEPVRFLKKAQRKPLLLLKALISFGGREVNINKVIDVLWPDASGDAAYSAFSTTLQRLRGILGNESAIQVSEGKVTLNPLFCWVDVWAFERILSTIETKTNYKKEQGKIINLCEKAISMYNGYFLREDSGLYWTSPMRERLRSKFIRVIINTGEYLRKKGKLKKVIELYQKVIEIDPIIEEVYQQLMKCYGALGYRGEVERLYRMCVNVLSTVLGVKPSPQTEMIYREAIK
jgi:DNA-binding SARP family transcriptional activator